MIRFFDLAFSITGILLLSPLLFIVFIVIWLDNGMPIFKQNRVGKNMVGFTLYKFRTMHPSTESVATHLIDQSALTRTGAFLRKSKIDELPQLLNVLIGDMSLVGPRPCLFSQKLLIKERELRGVFLVRPGITGLAQIFKIDMSTPKLLAEFDEKMISKFNLWLYFSLIFKTLCGHGSGDRLKF